MKSWKTDVFQCIFVFFFTTFVILGAFHKILRCVGRKKVCQNRPTPMRWKGSGGSVVCVWKTKRNSIIIILQKKKKTEKRKIIPELIMNLWSVARKKKQNMKTKKIVFLESLPYTILITTIINMHAWYLYWDRGHRGVCPDGHIRLIYLIYPLRLTKFDEIM